jgi:hypothetical protein
MVRRRIGDVDRITERGDRLRGEASVHIKTFASILDSFAPAHREEGR